MPFSDVIGHERPKAILRAALKSGRLAHAYLFHGEDRIGKRLTAIRLAQAIHCERPPDSDETDSCGDCRACRQVAQATHPDFLIIAPDAEQATPQIKIEQIRDLESQVIYRPLIGSKKVCILDEADRLTIGAANALLKTLEEPPSHSLFLLISSRLMALPGTIRSRCQTLRFAAPRLREVEAELRRRSRLSEAEARMVAITCGGRIGEALEADLERVRSEQREQTRLVSEDTLRSPSAILAVAEAFAKRDQAAEALQWLVGWIRDIILVRVGADPRTLVHGDQIAHLRALADRADVDKVLVLVQDLERYEQQSSRNLNLQLVLENVLLRLGDAVGFHAARPQPHGVGSH